ncbi:MAG: hypothetical protein BWK80_39520 [Desulfobacteraceae bacterium IS3]|nr:MAG: hypothetical protein BWK80_39520 [Desulfobacteraceae bacterium IS3]
MLYAWERQEEAHIKLPYSSICDFYEIITEGYFYADRTAMIEDAGKHLLFLRPRRFSRHRSYAVEFYRCTPAPPRRGWESSPPLLRRGVRGVR